MWRITVDGGVAQFSLKEEIHSDFWDAKKGRATKKTREQIALNRKIDKTEQSIRDIYAQTVETTGYVTAEQIKNELTGATTKAMYLLELFKEHNLEYKKRVGVDREERTYNNYVNSYNHLSRFILSKYNLKDFPVRQLDISFIDNYDLYLRVDAHLCTNTLVKHIIYMRKMVTRAINQKTILRDPFAEYVPSKQKSIYRHISGEELERIMTVSIKSKAVGYTRDMFVFSCFTGLAYADMCLLGEQHLSKLPDGSVRININRFKTEVESNIRLLDIPAAIIEKYCPQMKGDRFFKIPNSGALSRNMRKLEKLCKINRLHFHMARHTFATLICLSNGVSMEALSKMMGHSSIHTTQIYAEITNQKVGEDMKKLAKRLNKK
jgi:site-specific recombinase XerD